MITRIEATLPHLTTKAEFADLRTELLTALGDKPGRLYMGRRGRNDRHLYHRARRRSAGADDPPGAPAAA
jgi:hypothetical protein